MTENLPALDRPRAALVYSPHPILAHAGREVHFEPFHPGESVAAYIERAGIRVRGPVLLTLNDHVIARADWSTTYPIEGDVITLRAIVQGGGDGGSDPLRTALTIAVILAAPEFGLQLGQAIGATVGAAAIGQAIILVGGALLINALLPPPSPRSLSAGNTEKDSPTYSLSGGQNQARPFEPLPVVLGQHRIFPDAGAKPYTEFRGEDQFLYQVFNFGLSNIVLTELKIGDTLLADYTDVESQISGADGALTLFPANVDSIAGGALTEAADWITRTSSLNTTRLSIDIDGFLFVVGRDGIGERHVWIQIEYRAVGSGTWLPFQGFVDPLPAWTASTVYRANDFIHPSPTNGHVYRLINGAEQNTPPSPETSGPVQPNFAVAGPFVGIDITEIWYDNPDDPNSGVHTLEWRESGPYYTDPSSIFISSLDRKPVRRTYSRTVARGQYEVRVRRQTPDETDPQVTSEISFAQLRSYQPDDADYTGQTRLAVAIKATGQLNGVISAANAIATLQAPVWNGSTFVTQATNNPAWVYLYFARGKFDAAGRRVFGCGLADARLDIETLKVWATFCSAHGLTFNGVIDRQMNCQDVLVAIARCGRAAPSWATGKLGVVWDAPNQPVVAVFGMSNIKRSSFNVQYVTGELADEIVLHFINPALGWQDDVVRQLVPGVTQPVTSADVFLFGCTDKDMAGREANLIAAEQFFRRRQISWDTDLEGSVVNTGDVITLSHDLTQWGYSGRLLGGNGVTLQLDRAVTFTTDRPGFITGASDSFTGEMATGGVVTPAPLQHYVGIVFPNGFYDIFAVASAFGQQTSITLLDTWPSTDDNGHTLYTPATDPNHPPYDYKFVFDPKPTPGKLVKITSVKPNSERSLRITATDEDPAYYAAESGTFLYTPPQTFGAPIPTLSNLVVSDTLVRAGAGFATRITLSWDAVGPYSGAVVRAGPINEPLAIVGNTDGRSFAFQGPDSGRLLIRVAGFNFAGQSTPDSTIETTYIIVGKDRHPAPVTGLTGGQNGDSVLLSWDQHPEVDVNAFPIRFGKPGTPRDDMQLVDGSRLTNTITTVKIPPGLWDVSVSARDSNGNESDTDTRVTLTIVSGNDIILQRQEAPDWLGNRVLSFAGSGDYGDVPFAAAFDVERSDAFTVVVRFRSLAAAGVLLEKYLNDATKAGWRLGLANSGKLRATIAADVAGGKVIEVDSSAAINTGNFMTAGFTYDGSSLAAGLKLFARGAAVAMTVNTNTLTSGSIKGNTPLRTGTRVDGTNSLASDVAELWFIRRALTDDEMLHLERGTWPDVVSGDGKWIASIGTGATIYDEADTHDMALSGGYSWNRVTEAHRFVKGVDGKLIPDSYKLASEMTNAELFEQFVPYAHEGCRYYALELDQAFDDTSRVFGAIDSHLGPGESGIADPALLVDFRKATARYDGFEQWLIGDREGRYYREAIELDTRRGKAIIDGFVPTVDQKDFPQDFQAVIAPGGSHVTYPLPYHLAPFPQVTPVGSTALVAKVTNQTTTGFDSELINLATGVSVGGTENVKVRGV